MTSFSFVLANIVLLLKSIIFVSHLHRKFYKVIKFKKPVIDLKGTGNQIKSLRKSKGFTVRNLQDIFGFEFPQAIYSWEQGKNIPAIDNLIVLSTLFEVSMDQLIVTRIVEVDIMCSSDTASQLCNKKCDTCKWKLSA